MKVIEAEPPKPNENFDELEDLTEERIAKRKKEERTTK